MILLSLAAVAAIAWALKSDRSAQVLWLVTVVMTVAFLDAGSPNLQSIRRHHLRGCRRRLLDSSRRSTCETPQCAHGHPDSRPGLADTGRNLRFSDLLLASVIRSKERGGRGPGSARHCRGLARLRRDTRQRLRQSPSLHGPISALRHLYDLEQQVDLCTHTVSVRHARTEAIKQALSFARAGPTSLLLDFPLQTRVPRTVLCHAFTGAINPTEDYWLYSIDRAPCPA